MYVTDSSREGATIQLSMQELVILNNSLNEALGLGSELDARIGADGHEVATLLKQIGSLIPNQSTHLPGL